MGWWKRWLHSRGHGVHSPSAYRLIREVLCPSSLYGYYAYGDIHAIDIHAIADAVYSASELRLLYRVLVDMRPRAVSVFAPEQVERVAKLASVQISHQSDFAIVGKNYLLELPKSEFYFFFDSQSPQIHKIVSQMTEGHVFKSPCHCLILRRRNLPLQIFELNF